MVENCLIMVHNWWSWRFPWPWEYPNSWMVYKGKSHLEMDLGGPPFQETSKSEDSGIGFGESRRTLAAHWAHDFQATEFLQFSQNGNWPVSKNRDFCGDFAIKTLLVVGCWWDLSIKHGDVVYIIQKFWLVDNFFNFIPGGCNHHQWNEQQNILIIGIYLIKFFGWLIIS